MFYACGEIEYYDVFGKRRTTRTSQREELERLQRHLRGLCGSIPIPEGGSLTFISRHLPYGFAFAEVPSTHLFTYPDLGIAVINGLAAGQPRSRGVDVAVLVDPEANAPEMAPIRTCVH